LSQSRQGHGAALTEVLVFEPDTGARAQLKDLLGLFGFHVHETATLDEARNALAERERLAAVFLSVSFVGRDEADAVALCQLAKARAEPAAASERAPALLLVSTRARPVENIKAKLAGCDAFLVKPLTRGGVARAMEDCGVALPSDARRA
jgi:CheY-like chemotaxis protein